MVLGWAVTAREGSAQSGSAGGLSARELSAWRIFLRAHAAITRRLEHDLIAEHDLPLASYDVLLQLAESPRRRLRMTDLAGRVLLSRSGLSRLVDRLAGEGLVERQSCASDARGTYTVLTEAGLTRLRAAAPTHLRGISDYVTSRLTPRELDTLSGLLQRLLPPDEPSPSAGDCGAAADPGRGPAGAVPLPRSTTD